MKSRLSKVPFPVCGWLFQYLHYLWRYGMPGSSPKVDCFDGFAAGDKGLFSPARIIDARAAAAVFLSPRD